MKKKIRNLWDTVSGGEDSVGGEIEGLSEKLRDVYRDSFQGERTNSRVGFIGKD